MKNTILIAAIILFASTLGAAQPGTLDPSFSATAALTNVSTVNDIVVQPDGKILVSGIFTRMNGVPSGGIARLNADGTLDTTFSATVGANAAVNVIALQSDGKILIGGAFTSYNGTAINRFARLNSDGSLDNATFNVGTGLNGAALDIAVQPSDGKILVVGDFTNASGTAINRIARYNTDGTLDTANFDPGTGSPSRIVTVAVESGGTILVGGEFVTFNTASRLRIARLGTNGALDVAFTPTINSSVYAIELQTNGQILVGGVFTSITGVGGSATARLRLARLNTDGSLDLTFNPNVGGFSVEDIAIQLDSSIVFAGSLSSVGGQVRDGIGRVFGSGAVDTAYTARFNDSSILNNAVAVQADDAAIYGGLFQQAGLTTTSTKLCSSLLRVNSDGSIDAAFNATAGVSGVFVAEAREFVVRPNGKIVVGGNFSAVGRYSARDIIQLNADGTIDLTFNQGGFGGNNNTGKAVAALAEQPDGKIIVGGEFTNFNLTARNAAARLNVDGTIDPTFTSGIPAGLRINDIEVLTDGRMVMVGNFTTYSGQSRGRVVVVNADGSLDNTIFVNSGTGANAEINAVEVDANGRFIIAGTFISYNGMSRNRIARINADGSLDPTFAGAGSDGSIEAMELQPDGNIVIGGTLASYDGVNRRRIARSNADGTNDTSFTPANSGANSISTDVSGVALQTDGKILISGTFGTPKLRIARLNVDGSLDTNFNPPSGANDVVWNVVVQPDRKIIIGGAFTQVNGSTRLGIARLEPGEPIVWNGSVNTDWNTPANWTPAQVPTSQDSAIVPTTAPNSPVIGGAFVVNTLTVEVGKTATINGSLTTTTFLNSGIVNGIGTLIMSGVTNVNNGTISVADPRTVSGGFRRLGGTGSIITNFTINGGLLELSSDHQFSTISGTGGQLDIRTFSLRVNGAGNPINNTGGVFCLGGCRIEFNGTAAQTIGNLATGFLTINNPAGVTMSSNLTVTESLTLTSGLVNAGAFTLTLDEDATLIRTSGYVVGKLRKQFANGGGNFNFAVGTANGYSPVQLTAAVDSNGPERFLTIETFQTHQPALLADRSLSRFWRITAGAEIDSADMVFNYLNGDVAGNENAYLITRVSGVTPTRFANACPASPCVDTAANTATITGVTAFSDWTMSEIAPTSSNASVSGRVTTHNGSGIRNAIVRMSSQNGVVRTARTSAFGYYRFDDVATGQTCTLSIGSKIYTFTPSTIVVNVADDISDADFVASP